MSKTSPTPILIDTDTLSAIISESLSIAGVSAQKKQACLNAAARRIAGAKHNWGFLTGRTEPVVAQGLDGQLAIQARAPLSTETTGTNPSKDESLVPFPSMASWGKVAEIIEQVPDKAARRMDGEIDDQSAALVPHADVTLVDFDSFLEFMKQRYASQPKLIAYLETHRDAVEADFKKHATSPKSWQDMAQLLQVISAARNFGAEKDYTNLLNPFAHARFGAAARNLLVELGLNDE